ncbi:MAG: YeeE/YedE family protein [Parachlamydiales bacterium]|nr:YeeE/YedE family protein [Parachlamydiales bacterium]
MRKKFWSPYIAGIIIGLLQIPIFSLLHASLGLSGSYGSLYCFGRNLLSPLEQEWNCFPSLKNYLQLSLVIGIIIGAYISSRLGKMRRNSFSPYWKKPLKKPTLLKRIIMGFTGGFLLLLGANIAEGCTSGNGISGMALLSLGSYVVIASLFVTGILSVHFFSFLKNIRSKK